MRASLALAGALAIGAVSCSEPTAPEGRRGNVAIPFYIDRDGSGTRTPADTGLGGLSVGLVGTNAGNSLSRTGTTASDGVVQFTAVPAGVYSVTLPTTLPAGVVLASSPELVVRIDAIGQVTPAEARYAYLPGTIEGRLFNDRDASGDFTAGDLPGAGLRVRLLRGAPAVPVDSQQTDAEGEYRFRFLIPGAYTVEYEQPGTISFADGTSRSVTLAAGETAEANALFTGSLLVSIAEARAAAVGDIVSVRGVVTVAPGRFTSGPGGINSELWIEDATGGLAVFSVPSADSTVYALGDTVEATGSRGAFSGQIQIGSITRFERIAAGPARVPLLQTVAQARALTNDGRLVRVNGLRVVTVGGGTAPAFNVTAVNATDDTLTIRVAGTATGLTRASFTVGDTYDAIGPLTNFNGAAQLKIRSAADLLAAVLPTPIGTVRGTGVNGTQYLVRGALTVAPGRFTSGAGGINSEVWVQDATGGIAAFIVPTADTTIYALGDTVLVTGTRSAFNGQLQLSPLAGIERVGAGAAPAPLVQSAAQVNALGADGQLVRVNDLTVTAVGGGTGAAFNVTMTAPGGATVTVRVAGLATGLTRPDFVVGNTYDVLGILTQFNGAAQLKIRSPADLIAGTPSTPIGDVRATGVNGDAYTIVGTVTVRPGRFTGGPNSEIWVQDATGGIAVFGAPTADSLALTEGRVIRVSGTRGAFNGQLQIAGTITITQLGLGTPVTPLVQDGDDMVALTNEGRLVQLDDWTVTTIGGGTGAAFNVTGTTPDGATVTVRVSANTQGLTRANFAVGSTYSVIGVLSQFSGTAQIKIRTPADLIP